MSKPNRNPALLVIPAWLTLWATAGYPHRLLRSAHHDRSHIKQVQKTKLPLNIEC
jgi:hypothetical protein